MDRRDAWGVAGLWVLLAVVYAAIGPWGDFPLNDDFVFAETVRRLLETGTLRLSQWSLPANIPHILTGTLAALVVGAGDQALRGANMAVGACVATAVYLLLRDLRLPPARAFAGAATVACGPLFLAMAASFHADVNSMLWQTLGLWALVRGLRSGRGRPLAVASLLIGLCALNRQSSVLLLAGASIAAAREGRGGALRWAALWAPAAAVMAAYVVWFRWDHGLTWAWAAGRHTSGLGGGSPLEGLRAVVVRLAGSALTLGGLLLPLSAAAAPAVLSRRLRGREAAALAGTLGLCAVGLAWGGGMPLLENTLTRWGLGVVTLNSPELKEAGWWGGPWAWGAGSAVCLASLSVLARLPFAGEGHLAARGLGWTVAVPLAALFILPRFYDRYLLTVLPAAVAGVLLLSRGLALARGPAAVGCVLLAGLSTAGLRDYFAWNRARWDAGLYAVGKGLRPEQVENGFDWDGKFSLEKNMAALLARKPPSEIGVWDWMAVNRVAAITSFSHRPPLEGFVPA